MADWVNVGSSNLVSILYESGTLFVSFMSGDTYMYEDVPLEVYLGILMAPSKGKYHHRHIKWSYPFRKL
jgi:hypothetical protein